MVQIVELSKMIDSLIKAKSKEGIFQNVMKLLKVTEKVETLKDILNLPIIKLNIELRNLQKKLGMEKQEVKTEEIKVLHPESTAEESGRSQSELLAELKRLFVRKGDR
ncbi:MAG: hypothetical protein ACTSRS_07475 [Candidatus Helarchaeota archaeon]